MNSTTRSVGVLLGIVAISTVTASASAAPEPMRAPTLRSLDIELDLPESNLEISGFSPCGPVVVTGPVIDSTRPASVVEEAHGPLVEAFLMSETSAGPGRCRWIGGWADLTARGIFDDAGDASLAEASGLAMASTLDGGLEETSMPRWYVALRPR